MTWLNIPHLQQHKTGWCLPTCIAMVTAYLKEPLLQDDIARWLDTRKVGTPSSRIQRLSQRGFDVFYGEGALFDWETWLNKNIPCIIFLRTGELSYWSIDTPHAVVLAGLVEDKAYLFDPGIDTFPSIVSVNELMLASSFFDYTYAVLTLSER